MVAISAHRGGSDEFWGGRRGPVVLAAYRAAAHAGADYAEFDIRRTGDGELVIHHDARTRGGQLLSALSYVEACESAGFQIPRLVDAMATVAPRCHAHLDFKETGYEDDVVRLTSDIFGDRFVATGGPEPISAIRRRHPHVTTAVAVGLTTLRRRVSEPLALVRALATPWIAMNKAYATDELLTVCARDGIRVMVWTVDPDDPAFTRLLTDERVAVLITNYPAAALKTRATGTT